MKQANHLTFGNNQDPARGHRRRRGQTNRLTGEGAFPEEVARAHYSYNGLLASLGQHRQLHPALLNVEDGVRRIALGENGRRRRVVRPTFVHSRRIQERLGVEYTSSLECHGDPLTLSGTPAAVRTRFSCRSVSKMKQSSLCRYGKVPASPRRRDIVREEA